MGWYLHFIIGIMLYLLQLFFSALLNLNKEILVLPLLPPKICTSQVFYRAPVLQNFEKIAEKLQWFCILSKVTSPGLAIYQKYDCNAELSFREFSKTYFYRKRRKTASDYYHCMKSFCIQSFSGPSFPAFELNKERYSVMRENTDQKNSEYGHFSRGVQLTTTAATASY